MPLEARRADGSAGATEYLPLLAGARGGAQLEPANQATWHRGSRSAAKMAPGMYSWTKNGWPCDPGMVLPGPAVTDVPTEIGTGQVRGFAEQDGHIYVLTDRYVMRVPDGSGTPVQDQDLGASFAARSIKRFKSSLFVGGTGGNIWELPSGGAWTQAITGAAGVQRGYLGTVYWTVGGVTAERLIAEDVTATVPTILYVADDPRNDGDWSSAIAVGSYPITGIVSTRDHAYIATTGGVRDLDSTGLAPNLTPEVEALVLPTNGRANLAAGGWIYSGAGYGLLRVRVAGDLAYALTQWCSPGLGLPDESPISGAPAAITRKGEWLILAQWNAEANASYISWGREALEGEAGPIVWHSAPIVLPSMKVNTLHISGLIEEEPRLWIGGLFGTAPSLRWAPLALDTPYQDLRQGRAYQFAEEFELYESAEDWGDDTLSKDLDHLATEWENLGPGTAAEVAIAADGSTTYETLGTLSSSPRALLRATTAVKGGRLSLKITGTGTVVAPPILRKRSLRALPRPDLREVRQYQVLVGHAVRHQGGAVSGVDPSVRRDALARLQIGNRVTLRDEAGKTHKVLVLAPGVSFIEVEDKGANQRLLAANLAVAIAETSGVTATWDGGATWNSGRVWA
ncbi:MAG: hypothetical protein GEU71_03675 [Actinobacteria bacterium]|nr:hypothetical protein [Actinomycetota bacterium]